MRTRFLSALLLTLWLNPCAGSPAADLYFDRLTTVQGLSNNKVNCILQDRRGFIWMGTDDGLNRYDGHNFLVFNNKPGSPSGISGNIITGLVEDISGVVWIATADGGLTRYDYRLAPALQFKQYRHSDTDPLSIPDNLINDIALDRYGNIWLAAGTSTVLRLDPITGRFTRPGHIRGATHALTLTFDHEGMLWVGRQGGGILKIDPFRMIGFSDHRYEDLYAKLPHVAVSSIFMDRGSDLWFGSWDQQLYHYDHTRQHESIIPGTALPGGFIQDEILSFAEDWNGKLWIGGKTQGLQVHDLVTGGFTNYRYSASREGTLSDDRINCILITKEGIAFLGTNKGVSVSNPVQQQFSQVFLPRPPGIRGRPITIYDFYKDKDKALYMGTSEGLFVQRDGSTHIIHRPLIYRGAKLAVTRIFPDTNQTVYLGTDFSLFRYDLANGRLQLLPNTEDDKVVHKIINSRIVSIIRDSIGQQPVLLVSPYGHFMAYYELDAHRWVSRLDSARNIVKNFNLTDNLIRKFYKTSDGKIWIATAKRGLGEWVKLAGMPRVRYFRNEPGKQDGISNNDVYDIVEDHRGNLWVSTYGGGLHYFDTHSGRFTHIAGSNNLQEGLQVDASRNVWMISNGNLHRYNGTDSAYLTFDVPDVEKSGGVKGYLYQDADGRMYMAGADFFVTFLPNQLKLERKKPSVVFTDFAISDKSYSDLLYQGPIRLSHDQNSFSVYFSAPDYSPASPINYAYKLQGFDRDWIPVSSRNFVPYSNLPPGEYTFVVKATNDPGTWSDQMASLRIRIVPPYWKTWWFFLGCGVLLSLAIFGAYRYRVNEILKRQSIRNRIAQDLHDQLGSTLSSVSVYSEVAQIHNQQGNADMLREVLQKISLTSTEMISEMSDIVWAINPKNDSMDKILQRMDSYAKPLLNAKGITYEFNYGDSLGNLSLQMEQRKNFYLIFKEAVNNALKYSKCKHVRVKVLQHGRLMRLQVKDDGVGFNQDQETQRASRSLSGNGLLNMRSRAAEMNGECNIFSTPGQGTTVCLQFPIP